MFELVGHELGGFPRQRTFDEDGSTRAESPKALR